MATMAPAASTATAKASAAPGVARLRGLPLLVMGSGDHEGCTWTVSKQNGPGRL